MNDTEAELDIIARVLAERGVPDSRRIAHKVHAALLSRQIELLTGEVEQS